MKCGHTKNRMKGIIGNLLPGRGDVVLGVGETGAKRKNIYILL